MQIYAVNYFKLNCKLAKRFSKCNGDIRLDKVFRGDREDIIQDYFFPLSLCFICIDYIKRICISHFVTYLIWMILLSVAMDSVLKCPL